MICLVSRSIWYCEKTHFETHNETVLDGKWEMGDIEKGRDAVEASAGIATHLAANRANIVRELKTQIAANQNHVPDNRGHAVAEVLIHVADT
jgi:hypothetical protein